MAFRRPDSGAVWEETEDTGRQTEALPYISPIDFEELQKGNPDIYAWIEIDGAGVSYPVVQRPEDNAFYLDHNDAGQSDIYGAIFTEDYNSRDFEDAVTVIYGHTAKNGRMFGTLQRNYSDRAFFDSHRTIRIYLPAREMAYTIFAAVPYSNTITYITMISAMRMYTMRSSRTSCRSGHWMQTKMPRLRRNTAIM